MVVYYAVISIRRLLAQRASFLLGVLSTSEVVVVGNKVVRRPMLARCVSGALFNDVTSGCCAIDERIYHTSVVSPLDVNLVEFGYTIIVGCVGF